jgi:LCP family protein required for cell wall assembly
MSDDRGWYPGYGSDDRGGEGDHRDEFGRDPYAQGQGRQSARSAGDDGNPTRYGGSPQNPQPQQQWIAHYAGSDDDGYGYGRYDRENGGGDGGGRGGDAWSPSGRRPGSAGDRAIPVDAYPGRGGYDEGAWSPADPRSDGRGRGGSRGDGDADAWSPRTRRGGRAAASASLGLLEGHVNDDIDLDEIDRGGRARRAGARGAGTNPRRKVVKWTAIGVSSTLVLILGVGAFVIFHLAGNIRHSALLQNGVTQSPEPVDKYGRSPLNVLVIGSDTRSNAADCRIGGDCGVGANADVEIVVHLAADRSNATVMSIPRDTIVTLPRCTDPATKASGGGFSATINTSLQWGASCTVTAVHDLTGLTIDHFVMVDFSGVETLSNALGGVQVCVSSKMYDPYSKLRLDKGVNTVEGASALAFVRSRHGFYDGSDLGRERAQHYFLSAMIREVRANLNLSDFATLFKVADAATKALTVDDGLSGVTGVEGLATTMNRVPTDRISFVTMPWNIDPANQSHVVAAQPYADQMFQNILNDVPYTATANSAAKPNAPVAATKAAAPPTKAVAAPSVVVDKGAVHVQLLNGSGVLGRAADVRGGLVSSGFSNTLISTGNAAAPAGTTKVYYPSTRSDSAATVAGALGLPASALVMSNAYSQVTVVIGADWKSGTAFAATASSSAGPTPTAAASAPSVSSLSNAATTGTCVQANPSYIVK